MQQSSLLVLNSLLTYGRMAVTVGIGLVTTRLLVRILGFADFGVLTVLNGFGALVAALSEAVTVSAQRHLAYEIGRQDRERLEVAFNTTLLMSLGIAALAVLGGTLVASPIVRFLEIPEGRETVAFWAFLLTVMNLGASIMMAPFRAIVTAHQAMAIVAVIDVLQVSLRFGAVLALYRLGGDPLLGFTALTLLATLLVAALLIAVCRRWIPGCRFRAGVVGRDELERIGGFAGWNLMAQVAWGLRVQGGGILLNRAFGPLVNTADGLAQQIVSYQNSLGQAIRGALQPALVSFHGRGETKRLRSAVLLSGKYPLLVALFYMIPMQLEMESVLPLWLGEYPAWTAVFSRLTMVAMGVVMLSWSLALGMQAVGDIGRYTMIMVLPEIGILGAGTFFIFALGTPPWALPLTGVGMTVLGVLFQAWYVGRQLGFSLVSWLAHTVAPVAVTASAGLLAAGAVHVLMPPGVPRLVTVTIAYALVAGPTIWFFGLGSEEVETLRRLGSQLLNWTQGMHRRGTPGRVWP